MSAKFNWWSLGIGAAKSGHSSLDYRVRSREDVRDEIIDLLDGLAESLSNCVDIANPLEDPLGMHSAEPSTTGIGSDDEEVSELEEQMYYIHTALELLSRISARIRKSGTKFRHQRADQLLEQRQAHLAPFRDYLSWLILMGPLETHLLSWIQNRRAADERLDWAKLELIFRAKFRDHSRLSLVQRRVIDANIVRRNRIDVYRAKLMKKAMHTSHSAVEEHAALSRNIPVVAPVTTPVSSPDVHHQLPGTIERLIPAAGSTMGTSVSQSATGIGSSFELPSRNQRTGAKSVTTRVSNAVFKHDYPKCSVANGDFRCPLCAQPLDASYANSDRKWRGHVAEDLSPYVCVFAECETPDALYGTTDEWKAHLSKCHSVAHWVCATCCHTSTTPEQDEFQFDRETEWHAHMWSRHPGQFDEAELPILAEASQRTMVQPVSCPLCPHSYQLMQVEVDDHIAQHLHSFALQALPWEALGPDSNESIRTRASVGSREQHPLAVSEMLGIVDDDDDDDPWGDAINLPDLVKNIMKHCDNLLKIEVFPFLATAGGAIQLSFSLRVSSGVKVVQLLGSWDNYATPLPLSKTKSSSRSDKWKGTFRFQQPFLEPGKRYWYYYILNGYVVSHNSKEPSTIEPTTGRELNILDIPTSKSSVRPRHSSSDMPLAPEPIHALVLEAAKDLSSSLESWSEGAQRDVDSRIAQSLARLDTILDQQHDGDVMTNPEIWDHIRIEIIEATGTLEKFIESSVPDPAAQQASIGTEVRIEMTAPATSPTRSGPALAASTVHELAIGAGAATEMSVDSKQKYDSIPVQLEGNLFLSVAPSQLARLLAASQSRVNCFRDIHASMVPEALWKLYVLLKFIHFGNGKISTKQLDKLEGLKSHLENCGRVLDRYVPPAQQTTISTPFTWPATAETELNQLIDNIDVELVRLQLSVNLAFQPKELNRPTDFLLLPPSEQATSIFPLFGGKEQRRATVHRRVDAEITLQQIRTEAPVQRIKVNLMNATYRDDVSRVFLYQNVSGDIHVAHRSKY
ncbi:hypothetical protein GQ53DRAFT_546604 [Thozetella sp. PMI_491]|nr:hypothetical protein GQ53DRAFT_546604 [Thozetella sp. PMI_491]